VALKAWGDPYRTTVIALDSYQDRVLKGRLYNPYRSAAATFTSTLDLLTQVEDLLDEMQFPAAYTTTRSFSPPAAQETAAQTPPPDAGRLATFAVRVLFRQNASWQGAVRWVETDQEESFRSVLELLFLIDGALRAGSTA
jgi:hypothetical protein